MVIVSSGANSSRKRESIFNSMPALEVLYLFIAYQCTLSRLLLRSQEKHTVFFYREIKIIGFRSMTSRLARWWVLGRKDIDAPLVTVIKLSGILQAGLTRGPAARRFINLDRIEKHLQRAFHKPIGPAACAISINSPGGSPVQSELIYNTITKLSRETNIPVFTFAEDVAASGGYFLLCAGKESYACSTSLVGSIGVVSASFGVTSAAQRLGVERRVYTAGKAKMQIDPFSDVTDEQRARLMDIMVDVHESFKTIVKKSRGDRLQGSEDELFSGRAWTGNQALSLGLIDGVGSLKDIMKEKFGDRTRFLLCSESPQPGLRDILGFGSGSSLLDGVLSKHDVGTPSGNHSSQMLEDVGYSLGHGVFDASIDGVEEREVWANYGVKLL